MKGTRTRKSLAKASIDVGGEEIAGIHPPRETRARGKSRKPTVNVSESLGSASENDNTNLSAGEESGVAVKEDLDNAPSAKKRLVWVDPDDEESDELQVPRDVCLRRDGDEEILDSRVYLVFWTFHCFQEYQRRLKRRFEKGKEVPLWAAHRVKRSSELDEDLSEAFDSVERSSNMTAGRVGISAATLKADIKKHLRLFKHKQPVSTVCFHKARPVVVSSSGDGVIAFSSVYEKRDQESVKAKLEVRLENFPVSFLHLVDNGDVAFVSSKAKAFFHSYDLNTASIQKLNIPKTIPWRAPEVIAVSPDDVLVAFSSTGDKVYVLARASMEFVCAFNSLSPITALQFNPVNPKELFGVTGKGMVHIWTIGIAKTLTVRDLPSGGNTIAINPQGTHVAFGYTSGIVDLFEMSDVHSAAHIGADVVESAACPVKPLMSCPQLTTPTCALAFNPDSQLLAFASRDKSRAMRLLHVPRAAVVRQFPGREHPIVPTCLSFSPHGRYLAVGTPEGFTNIYGFDEWKY